MSLTHRFQSAYLAYHGTESALLSVLNDLLVASGNDKVSILTLLDLSAAFDTIDHCILLGHLRRYFGISGSAYHWFQTFFSQTGSTSPL